MRKEFWLGKPTGTIQMSNNFWIKKFENGVKLRKKGEGEISLDDYQVMELLFSLRKFGKGKAIPLFLSSIDLIPIYQKFPKTKEFVERLLTDEVTDEEKIKIHDNYMGKLALMDKLEDEPKI